MRIKGVVTTLAGIVSASVLSSCSEMYACKQAERDGYPALEQTARAVMANAPSYDMQRGSLCEDAVQPGASVDVRVGDWKTRAEGNRYLRGHGYRPYGDSGSLLSPDGKYVAHTSLETKDDEPLYVWISFDDTTRGGAE